MDNRIAVKDVEKMQLIKVINNIFLKPRKRETEPDYLPRAAEAIMRTMAYSQALKLAGIDYRAEVAIDEHKDGEHGVYKLVDGTWLSLCYDIQAVWIIERPEDYSRAIEIRERKRGRCKLYTNREKSSVSILE